MPRLAQITFLVLVAMFLGAGPATATTISVAVAANFLQPLAELATLFEAQSGIKVAYSSSSTGKLYAQISNGAPYDLFLAADAKRPELLAQAGLAEEPKIYARGRVVLWTRDHALAAADWQQALAADPGRIAIASPAVAPYGAAATTALKAAGLWQAITPRLVYAQSAGQAFQYGEQRATRFSFAALSYCLSDTGQKGRHWPISQAPAVVQKGCLLTKAPHKEAARRFWEFLFTPPAAAITAAYGYQ